VSGRPKATLENEVAEVHVEHPVKLSSILAPDAPTVLFRTIVSPPLCK
jgi:hypothetical protein